MAKKQFATNIDVELLKAIKMRAIQDNRPVNEILEHLIRLYLSGEIELPK